jgi:hypothetical protein
LAAAAATSWWSEVFDSAADGKDVIRVFELQVFRFGACDGEDGEAGSRET